MKLFQVLIKLSLVLSWSLVAANLVRAQTGNMSDITGPNPGEMIPQPEPVDNSPSTPDTEPEPVDNSNNNGSDPETELETNPSTVIENTVDNNSGTNPEPVTGETPDTNPEPVTGETPDTNPEPVTGETPDTNPEPVTGETPDTNPEPVAEDNTNNNPEPVAGETPDTNPEPVTGETPDTNPEPVTGETPDTNPEPVAGETPDTNPEPVTGETPDTNPEPVTGETPDTNPEPVTGETPDTNPEPVTGETPDTNPEPVAEDNTNNNPEPVAGETPDTNPEPVAGETPDTNPEPVAEDNTNNNPEPVAEDNTNNNPEPVAEDNTNNNPEPVAGETPDTNPEPVAGDNTNNNPEPVAGETPDTNPEPVAEDNTNNNAEPVAGETPDTNPEPVAGDNTNNNAEPVAEDNTNNNAEPVAENNNSTSDSDNEVVDNSDNGETETVERSNSTERETDNASEDSEKPVAEEESSDEEPVAEESEKKEETASSDSSESDISEPIPVPIDRATYETYVQEATPNTGIELNEEFQAQLISNSGVRVYGQIPSSADISTRLGQLWQQTGKKPAFINISLQSKQLDSFVVFPTVSPIASNNFATVASTKITSRDLVKPQQATIRHTASNVSRKDLLATAKQFREQISNSRNIGQKNYLASSEKLYRALIEPMEAELKANNIDILVFSMDSGLRLLPLAALYDGRQFLIEKYAVALVPSFGLTDTRYVNLNHSNILAMGASEFTEQSPLPTVPIELQNIISQPRQGELFLNEQFTVDNFKNQNRLDRSFKIIHLGTHADFQSGDAKDSYIQFYDRKLQLSELRKISHELGWNNTDNTPVELLVLSACETAIGDEKAELGFAGLAVQAGVKSALASLWYVSDLGTLALMSEFYDRLDDTLIKAEALRQTQLEMLKGDVMVDNGKIKLSNGKYVPLPAQFPQGQLTLSDPYFWSAFTLIGNWN
jgi:CHAT domain-containing protein